MSQHDVATCAWMVWTQEGPLLEWQNKDKYFILVRADAHDGIEAFQPDLSDKKHNSGVY